MCSQLMLSLSPPNGIDSIRFDVRGFLSSPQSFEPEKIDLSPAELEQERLLDEERFRDLISDEVVDAQGEHAFSND